MSRRGRGSRRGYARTAIGFILGLITGGVVAVFSAPASGRALRRRFLKGARNVERQLERRIGRTRQVLLRNAGESCDAATGWITEHIVNGQAKRPVRSTNGHTRRSIRRRRAVSRA